MHFWGRVAGRLSTVAIGVGLASIAIGGVSPSNALADSVIGSPGSGAGQLTRPTGVAVDRTEDLLYVADRGNFRIAVFDASSGAFVKAFGWGVADGVSHELQVCTATCFKGIEGTGAGQFSDVAGVAVDNDLTSTGFHSIYTFEPGGAPPEGPRVQKFTPSGEFVWAVGGEVDKTTSGNLCTLASGNTCGAGVRGDQEGHFNPPAHDGVISVQPGGALVVGDRTEEAPSKTRLQRYSPAGSYLGQQLLTGPGSTTGVAVDSEGNVYVGTAGATGVVRKYDPSGTELFNVDPSFNINFVAVDTDDNLYISDNTGDSTEESQSAVLEYSPTGTQLRTFYALHTRLLGMAPYANPNGDVFAAEEEEVFQGSGRVVDLTIPPPGPVVYPNSPAPPASSVGNTKATLRGKVNPEGEATTFHFEYIRDEDFEADGESFGVGTISTPESGPIGSDFALHLAEAQLTGLFPETVYHFRVVGKNASAPGGRPGPTRTFETKGPLEFGDLWSTGVGTDSANLHAEVNPLGIPATARFEYVELAKYEASGYSEATQVPRSNEDPIDLGEGEAVKEVSAQISGLTPGTAYRYRVVATNRCKPEPAPLCDFVEPEGTFITFAVIIPAKGCPNDTFREREPGKGGPGELLPDCRAYEMVSPIDKNGVNVEPVANISGFPAGLDRAATSGEAITYSAYRAFGEVASSPYTNQYLSSRDAASGWQTEAISPKREGPALMTYGSAALDRQYRTFSSDLCSGWVVQDANPTLAGGAPLGFPGLYRRENCEPGTGSYEALTTVEPPNLPPKKFNPEVEGISADGSVTIFSVNDNLTPDAPAQPQECVEESSPSAETCLPRIYEAKGGGLSDVCILPGGTPYAGGCTAGSSSQSGRFERFGNVSHAISDDGSRIFWTAASVGAGKLYARIGGAETVEVSSEPARFWSAAADGSKAIYTVGKLASDNGEGAKLLEFDVESEVATVIAEGVQGVAGVGDDASRVYFASIKVLTENEQNSAGDHAIGGKLNLYLYEAVSGVRFVGTLADSDGSAISLFPASRLSRVNPSGEQMAFMSYASLTGYDNTDAVTGQPDMEVFLYDATANGGEGKIACPSCNPSGARPIGRRLTQKLLEEQRGAARIPAFESQLYGQRVLSDDGKKLYFDSFESLVSTDINEQEDVYQWEAPGSGSCTSASQTFQASSGGCVDLISSGTSLRGSELTDSSSDGRDVFFKTHESLVSQDPGLLDIYDARVDGGFPALRTKPVICEGEGCPAPPKAGPEEVAPASRVSGPGNPPQSSPNPPRCPKGKHKVKRNGKVRCVPNKHKKKHHHHHHHNRAHRDGRAAR